MSELGKEDESWFYIKYSIYNHELNLWIKGCQLFRNCMWDVTNQRSCSTVLTYINDVGSHVLYIVDDTTILF